MAVSAILKKAIFQTLPAMDMGRTYQYLDCSQGVQADLIALDEVGHDWPINVEGYRAHDVHAAEIWQFLKQFSLWKDRIASRKLPPNNF